MWLIVEMVKNGLVQGVFISLLAVSFAWVYQTTRVFHVAIAVPLLAGAYAAIYAYRVAAVGIISSIALGIFSGVASTFAISLVYAYLQRREASNSLRLIASLGIYFAVAGTFALVIGPDIKTSGISAHSSWQIGHMVLTEPDVRYMASGLLIFAGLGLLLRQSDLGRGIAAASSNRQLYLALGKNEGLMLALVYVASGAIAGLCGAYEGLRNGADPYGFLPAAITAAVAALIGGRSLLLGPVTAGIALGMLRAFTTQVISDRWVDTVIYGLLFALLCFGPAHLLCPAIEEERP